eukprot:TRINITY_DN480_c0_g1_i26.p4 TRINITY_DN480_c0_g1~~TRINITY_DN480_c0_g1_i26.p4  ORF type:complete len:142 (+),score=26.14 TRINITY_DN480_c0_g1_i26:894-1319(+)
MRLPKIAKLSKDSGSHLSQRRTDSGSLAPLDTITENMTMGNRIVVYKKARKLNEEMYVVEISKSLSDENKQAIFLYPLFGNARLHLSIPANMYGDAEADPESIVSRLRLKGSSLFIVPSHKSRTRNNISATKNEDKDVYSF